MTATEYYWSIDPECAFGYGEAQLRAQLSDSYVSFKEYMLMKAGPMCSGPFRASAQSAPAAPCTATSSTSTT